MGEVDMGKVSSIDELFIVGNGFDLQCGLGTTYENFLKYTFSRLEQKEKAEIGNDELFNLDAFSSKVSESLSYTQLYKEDWSALTPLNYYHQHNYFPQLNIWYHIFLYEKLLKNVNWSSVESLLATYLDEYTMIDYISRLILKNKSRYVSSQPKPRMSSPRNNRSGILSKITYILIKKDLESLPLSNEIPYNRLRDIYNNPEQVSLDSVKELVTQILLSELNELEYDFQLFLRYRLDFCEDYFEKVNDLLCRMLEPEKGIYSIEPRPYYLLSFNYSSLWSKRFRPKYSPQKFLDIHGKIPKDSYLRYSSIIFGVDTSLFEADSFEYRFTKTYRTLKNYSVGFENAGSGREIYDSNIKTLKFYGHSLAEADYAYFQQLFDYYDLYKNHELKLIFYYSVYDEAKAMEIEQEQIYNVSRLIEKYGQTMDNKDHGKNVLTRLIQTNRLQLKKL